MAQDFQIPVDNGAYSGSSRAKSAISAAKQSGMHTPMVGEGPNAGNKSDGPTIKRANQTPALPNSTKPAVGASNPNYINPEQNPGVKANKTNTKG